MAQIMPAGFEPRQRGRRPVYDVTQALKEVDSMGHTAWVKFEVTPQEARSARKQIEKLTKYEVGVEQSKVFGKAFLYIRSRG